MMAADTQLEAFNRSHTPIAQRHQASVGQRMDAAQPTPCRYKKSGCRMKSGAEQRPGRDEIHGAGSTLYCHCHFGFTTCVQRLMEDAPRWHYPLRSPEIALQFPAQNGMGMYLTAVYAALRLSRKSHPAKNPKRFLHDLQPHQIMELFSGASPLRKQNIVRQFCIQSTYGNIFPLLMCALTQPLP